MLSKNRLISFRKSSKYEFGSFRKSIIFSYYECCGFFAVTSQARNTTIPHGTFIENRRLNLSLWYLFETRMLWKYAKAHLFFHICSPIRQSTEISLTKFIYKINFIFPLHGQRYMIILCLRFQYTNCLRKRMRSLSAAKSMIIVKNINSRERPLLTLIYADLNAALFDQHVQK